MLHTIWSFLENSSNRELLSWIGGGAVLFITGVWAVLRFFLTRNRIEESVPATNTSATNGGVVVGGNVQNSKINTHGNQR
jgi:hypothetical protein